ncbi:hypothetical protein HDU67_004932 [Dinochytrium kinnereticum]|nr:hypothetical protein HDU67_004932 [Dinochytrium kinnereticum]
MESLRASGVEEEYTERDQLLGDIFQMMEEFDSVKKEKTAKEKKKADEKEEKGQDIRLAAMEGLVTKKAKSESGDSSMPVSSDDDREEIRKGKKRKSGRSSLSETMGGIGDYFMAKAKSLKLDDKSDVERLRVDREIEARDKELSIRAAEIDLAKQRFELEKKLAERKLVLEEESRRKDKELMMLLIGLVKGNVDK